MRELCLSKGINLSFASLAQELRGFNCSFQDKKEIGEGRPYSFQFADWLASTTYNAAGEPTQLMTPCANGTCYPISYQYDPNTLRMTQYSYALADGTVSGSLTWNPNGSLQKLVIADPFNSADAQTCDYSADDLSRIASVSCGSTWAQTFTYDAFGNLTKNGSISWIPGYNTSTNRYSLAGTSYDADGNVLKDTFNYYTWDAEGKTLSTAYDNGGGQTWTFTYDAFGHKVEWLENGNYESSYVTLGNYKLSATGQTAGYSLYPLPGGSFISEGGGWTGIQMADWLGTIRAVANDSADDMQTGAHAPFGEEYSFTSAYPKPSIFTGQEDDGNDNPTTYYFPERHYASTQGRWLSPDPAGLAAADPSNPQSWNRYAYVLNNPLSYTDPLGLYCYYGDTSEGSSDWGDSSQYDFHSDQGTCEGNGPEGGGTWFDDPSTTVTVNGNTNEVDTLSTFTGNDELTPLVTVQRSFSRSFPCSQGGSGAVGNLANNFPAAANWSWGPLHVTFLQRGPLTPGSVIPIDGPVGAWASEGGSAVGFLHAATSAVTVASVSSNSFTFATVPGMHPFDNGTVTFSASDAANGNINFGVEVNAAFASNASKIEFNFGGSKMEASIWHNLINNVQAGCH